MNYNIDENWEINNMLLARDQVRDVITVSNTDDDHYDDDDNCNIVHLLLLNPIRMPSNG
jgi:hypothetical protein